MKRSCLIAIGGVVSAVVVLALVAQVWVSAQEPSKAESTDQVFAEGKGARALEGTWINQTHIVNCQTGTVMQSFSKLTTFHMGGTANEASASSLFRTTSFGNWEYTGPNSFRYGLQAFRFNSDGTFAGSFRVVWTEGVNSFV